MTPSPAPLGDSASLAEQMQEQQHLLELQNEQLRSAHQELEASQHRYADLYDLAPVCFLTLDRQGCIREINQTATQLLGWPSAHLLGRPLLPHIAPPDRKAFLKHLWDARHRDAQQLTSLQLLDHQGQTRQVQLATSRSRDASNRPTWCRTAIFDISQQHQAEQALSAIQTKFRLMAENIGEIIWFMSANPIRITYINPAFERLWGISAEQLYTDLTLWETPIHPDDLLTVRAAFKAWIEGATPDFQIDYRIMTRHGTLAWLSVRGIVIGYENGRPAHFCGISSDITNRKNADQRFRNLMEAAPDAILITDPQGLIQLVNIQALRLFGYERSELIGQPMDRLVPEAARALQSQHRAAFAANPRSQDLLDQRFELPGLRSNGSQFPSEVALSPLHTQDGLLTIHSIRDITERKRAEAKFRGLLESAPDAMIIVNQRGLIELVNAQAVTLFGYSRQELLGLPLENLVPKRLRQAHLQHRNHYHADPQPRRMGLGSQDLLALRKDGSEFPTEINLSPLETDRGTLYISSVRDVTERRLIERRLRDAQLLAQSTLEATPASLGVLNHLGTVISTNQSWDKLTATPCSASQCPPLGTNYLDSCRASGSPEAAHFADAIHRVIHGIIENFSMEYSCHTPDQNRWFVGYITPFSGPPPHSVVVAHVDISQRKQAEQLISQLNAKLESRVAQRTAELLLANQQLHLQIDERLRLEEEILEVSEREQQRIGRDLHDDLGQQLAAASMMCAVHVKNLAKRGDPEIAAATRITELLKKSVSLTRGLARGLHPVAPEPGGLVSALRDLVARSAEMFQISCRLICPKPVTLDNNTTATHLYRIAQEALSNSVKHGQAKEVDIELSSNKHQLVLSLRDNGSGLPPQPSSHLGMGRRIMHYRCDMIGATLSIQNNPSGPGTILSCSLPHQPKRHPKRPHAPPAS